MTTGNTARRWRRTAAFLVLCASLAVPLLGAGGSAQAAVQVSNFDESATSTGASFSGIVDIDLAQVFMTGTNATGYTLTSVEMAFDFPISSANIGGLSVEVWSVDGSGNPQTKQFDLTKPTSIAEATASSTGSGINTAADITDPYAVFTAPSNTTLTTTTDYAVVLNYNRNNSLWITDSDTENLVATGWSIADNSLQRLDGGPWTDTTPSPRSAPRPTHLIRVNSDARVANAETGKPGITGTAAVGEVLTATVGTIADSDGLPDPLLTNTDTGFQWIRVTSGTDADILGATASTYTLVAADEGKKIRVEVSFLDDGGGSEALTSVAYPLSGTVRSAALAHCNMGNPNKLWCATLTVGTIDESGEIFAGYYGTGPDRYGSLAPNTFTYRAVRIEVLFFDYGAGTLDVGIGSSSMPPADGFLGSGIYTLEIGTSGDKQSVVAHNPGTYEGLVFDDPGLNWSVGDMIPVKLVRAPNTAPTSEDSTVIATEDMDYNILTTDFPYMDTDAGAQLVSVKIESLPASGTLTFSNTALTSEDLPYTVPAEYIGSSLEYAPPTNGNGDALATFTFRVNDGAVDSATPNTVTINVTAVNDAATGTPGISGTATVGEVLTATVGTSGLRYRRFHLQPGGRRQASSRDEGGAAASAHGGAGRMNVLMTGGAGFIGAALVERLVAGGHFVAVVADASVPGCAGPARVPGPSAEPAEPVGEAGLQA